MSEISKEALASNLTVEDLKIQIAVLTCNPDAALSYRSEDERTKHIEELKSQLAEHGIDGNQFQTEVVINNFKLKVPLNNVIDVDFTQKAS